MKRNYLLRLKVGIILNLLLLGCMVFFLSFAPLLISSVHKYLGSGDSIFFPQLLTKLEFLPLTLGQFFDQSIILFLLWFVVSSFFPLVRKFRERLKLYPDQMVLPEGKESDISPRSWMFSDISSWDKICINSPKSQPLIPEVKNGWEFEHQVLSNNEEKIPQLNQIKFAGNRYFVLSSCPPLLNWNESISAPLFVNLNRFTWILFKHAFLDFVFSQNALFPGANSNLVFLDIVIFQSSFSHKERIYQRGIRVILGGRRIPTEKYISFRRVYWESQDNEIIPVRALFSASIRVPSGD